jgi:predicted component of type VI protein secretion system
MRVNAYTTLDIVDATIRTADDEATVVGVANATSARENPEHVQLRFEADDQPDGVARHVDELELVPEQARDLAAALETHADTVEAAQADDADD